MTTYKNTGKDEFVTLPLTADLAKWFIEKLVEELDQAHQENEMLKTQIARLKEVKR